MMKMLALAFAATATASNVSGSHRQLQDAACPDLNADGAVNVSDLLMLLAAYGTGADGDTNGDGNTDVADLLALLAAYGASGACSPGGGGAQPVTFGNIAFESRNCEYDATAAAGAGYVSPAALYDQALTAFNACPQPDGYCTRSLNSGIELSNRGVCGSGGDGAYAAGWNGFASAGGPDMNENIGFHITAPFNVDAAGTYAFRLHSDYGRGAFMGVDAGLRLTPGDFWGHYQMAAAAMTQGDHVFEALGFEGCCDGHSELEVHLPCDGVSDPWRVVQAGASDCMTCTGGIGASFSAFKFNLDPAGDETGLRNWAGANSIQLAEITLYDPSGTPLREGIVCTNPDGNNPGGELPEHACNGLTEDDPNGCDGCANSGHKWLDFNKGDLVMTFPDTVTVGSWDWQTANDSPNRDPTKWSLQGSNDGTTWQDVDMSYATTAFATTDARFTWQGPFQIAAGGGADASCADPRAHSAGQECPDGEEWNPTVVACAPPALERGCLEGNSGDTTTYDTIFGQPLSPSDKSVVFTVRAGSDAHLGFFGDSQANTEVYEVVLSGWGNTMSTIRPCNQCDNSYQGEGADGGRLPTPGLLSADEDRTFWATANYGLVVVGTGGDVGNNEIMRWQDPEFHEPVYVGIMTGWGATGAWTVCATGWVADSCSASGVPGVTYRRWDGVGGTDVAGFLENDRYVNNPADTEDVFMDFFESPVNVCDNCGTEMEAWYRAQETGPHTFRISADDNAHLWFGADVWASGAGSQANEIASVPGWSANRQWDKYPEQTAAPIDLVEGNYYYMRAIANEGAGGDNLEVGVDTPTRTYNPIPVCTGSGALLFAQATGVRCNRWNGIGGTGIEELLNHGLGSSSLVPDVAEIKLDFFEAPVNVCDNCGTEMSAYMRAPVTGTYTFRISADDNAHLWFGGGPSEVNTEETQIAGVPGWSANRQWDKYPEQTAAPVDLVEGTFYWMRAIANEGGGGDNLEVGVTIAGVGDFNPIPVVHPDVGPVLFFDGDFTPPPPPPLPCVSDGVIGVNYRRWEGIDGTALQQLLSHDNYNNNPPVADGDYPSGVYSELFEAPVNICDNCGTEMDGYFMPPQSGAYIFHLSADDNAALNLGATVNGAMNSDPIATVPGWSANRQWDKYASQTSPEQTLQAGVYYYVRAVANEGGGGDNLEVGVTYPDGQSSKPSSVCFDQNIVWYPEAVGVKYMKWLGIDGTGVAELLGHANYNNNPPDEVVILQEFFEAPVNVCDNCGTDMEAYFKAPADGDYEFQISADDNAFLWIGASVDEAMAADPVASVPGWSGNRQWNKYAEQQAAAVTLAAGSYTYMRAIANEGGGGDNLEIGVANVDGMSPIPVFNADGSANLFTDYVGAPLPAVLPCPDNGNNGVIYRRWDGVGGTSIGELIAHANYQSLTADETVVFSDAEGSTNLFEAPVNVCDNCGTMIEGYFIADQDGDHTFRISADDNAHLWFGATINAALDSGEIASVPGWSANRQWDKYAEQTADPISLTDGSMYYMRAIANEGGGGDNLEVGVTFPDGTTNNPIKICDSGSLRFVTDARGVNYRRWDGIGGVTMDELLAHAHYAEDADFNWVVTDFFETPTNVCDNCASELDGWFTPTATGDHVFQLAADDFSHLWVGTSDADAMSRDPIANVPGWTGVRQWDKYAEQQAAPMSLTAGTPVFLRATANEGGGGDNLCVGVTGASGDLLPIPVTAADGTVLLTADMYTPPPPPPPCTTGGPVGITYRRWEGIGGTAVAALLDSEGYSAGVASADVTETLQIFETPVNVCDNCGSEVEGYFLANEDGEHTFRISADDNAHFWFGETMADAMSSPEIASVPGWSANRQWNKYPEQTAAPITLNAGSMYYIRAIANEGGGGDNLELGVTTPSVEMNPMESCVNGITYLFTDAVGVNYMRWNGIGGTGVAELLGHANFNNNAPDVAATLTEFFESPVNVCDNCGTMMDAYFKAAEDGAHTFRISADDNAHLWFGASVAEAMASEIASVPGWSANRQWDKYAEQTAEPITLSAGTFYYMRAVANEGGGGDNLEVGVTTPSGDMNPIPVSSGGAAAAVNVALGRPATQSSEGWGGAAARATDGDRNGGWGGNSCTHSQNAAVEWWQVDLGASTTVTNVDIYHRTDCCQDRLGGAVVTVSATADYTSGGTVCGDVDVAAVSSVDCGGAEGQFVTVSHADQFIAICEAEVFAPGAGSAPAYYLFRDARMPPPPPLPCPTSGLPGVTYRRWNGVGGTDVAGFLANDNFSGNPPDVEEIMDRFFESPVNVCDTCGTEMEAWFLAADTGAHTFRVSADDNAHVWFGENFPAAMAAPEIASVPGWSANRQWDKYPEQTAEPIDLVAGKYYYMRAVANEGGGGDNLEIGVTTPTVEMNPIQVCGEDGNAYLMANAVGVYYQRWNGIGGTGMAELLAHPSYVEGSADEIRIFVDEFEAPVNICDNCGTEMHTYFKVPMDGDYTFRVSADDNAHLWFGASMDEALAADPIASVPGWSANRQWDKYAEQTAATVTLAAGDSYFMRATANEGGGGDNLEVGVSIAGVGDFNPIPVMHPTDPTVALLVFDGDMSPPPPAPLPCAANAQETQYNAAAGGVNWRKWNDIGGTGVQQLLDAQIIGGAGAAPDDSDVRDIFEAPVNICDNCGTEMDGWFKAATTGDHTFLISADDNAHLWFGATVNEAIAQDPIANVPGWSANRQWNKYDEQTAEPINLIGGNFYYMRAIANEGGGGDNLEVGVQAPGDDDLLPIPACSAGGNQYLYTVAAGVTYRRWNGIGGTGVAELLGHANYNGNPPDETGVMTAFFEAPVNVCDNCGTDMEAYFKAPADGDYEFQISADDNAFLWIGASVDEAMAADPVASVPGWSANRQWNKYAEQQAAAVTLAAGSYTYMRAIANEGGGGDNLEVGIANVDGMSPIPVTTADGAVLLVTDYVGIPAAADLPCQDTASPGVTYRRWDGIGGTGVAELLEHADFTSRWGTACNGAHQSTTEGFEVAQAICTSIGARLCSAAELNADEARGTGCGHDDRITWTSDTCDGGHMTADGDSRAQANYADPECRAHDFNGAVRCCATGAELCADLNARFGGWPTELGDTNVCGESDNGLGPPTFTEEVMSIFEAPVNVCDNCGTELEAYFQAPETGDYVFRISADDNAFLWVGETMNTAMQADEIASVPGWSANRQWDKYAAQTAAPMTLQAGQKYYMRAIANEGGGGDNLEVGVTTPTMGDMNPIPVCQAGTTFLFTDAIGVMYRRWDGIGGTGVAELLNHDSFNGNPPSASAVLLDFMEAPVNICDNCGTTLDAWFVAPVTGPFIFRISADDNAHLWFGSDPASAIAAGEIASVPGWSANRQWNKYAEQTAAPVDLVGGQAYFLRALSNEGGGGDNTEVGVTLPGLRTPNLAQGATATQSTEGWGGAAARAVDGDRTGGWGGNSCTHTHDGETEWWQVDLGASADIDHVDLYHRADCCQDRLGGAQVVVSATADYSSGTVCGDVDVSAVSIVDCGGATGQFVTVTHASQFITICEAEVFAVGGVAEVVAGGGASLNPIPVMMENGAVLLKFDGSFNPAPDLVALECSQDGMPGVNYKRWEGIGGTGMAEMLNSDIYAGAPTAQEIYGTDGGMFESPTNICDNCATEMDGWFTPSVDGDHTFRIAADDNAYLWFGESFNAAMAAEPIASVPGWSAVRQWDKYATQTAAPISLIAGKAYFIRMAFNEGGGGDNGAVGVTTPDATYNPIRVCADGIVFLQAQNVGAIYRLWNGIGGTGVAELLSHTNYNNQPPDQSDVLDIFESPTNVCDNCGTEMEGWFKVADTGPHTWKLAADDNAFLWVGFSMWEAMSSDPVASVPGWSGVRQWDKYAEQTAAAVDYTAGDYVFLRTVANEGGGGDNLAVGVVTPAASLLPIPAADDTNTYLYADGSWAPAPPPLPCQDVGVPGVNYARWNGIGGTEVATLLSNDLYSGSPPDESAVMDIFEAPVNVCDNCGTEMQAWFMAADSGPHTFRISADDNAHLWFGTSQRNAMDSAEIASVPGWSANRQWDKYPEQTAESIDLVAGTMYYLRAVANEGGGGDNLEVGVSTPSVTMNPIESCKNGNLYLFASPIGVAYRRWAGIAGTGMDELLAHANYAADADFAWITYDFFESPTNVCDNCGTEMDGWFVPNADGDHVFQLAADDNSHLWFGIDEASAMAADPIASIPGWTAVRQWDKYGSQQASPVTLTAGTPYFLRATANEGGGGDNLCVGVTGASGDMLPIPVMLPPTNIAQGRPATQSSEGWGGAAARAVDGNRNGGWGGNSCTHTQNAAVEWWQVDLGASNAIGSVALYHRTDCCQDRLVGAVVTVSATADYTSGGTVCGDVDMAAVSSVDCGGAEGQFVTVSHADQVITICEAEVYPVGAVATPQLFFDAYPQLVFDD